MSTSLEEQIKQLKITIAEMESQRTILGEDTVTAAPVPLRQKLAELEMQIEPPEPELPNQQRKLVALFHKNRGGEIIINLTISVDKFIFIPVDRGLYSYMNTTDGSKNEHLYAGF